MFVTCKYTSSPDGFYLVVKMPTDNGIKWYVKAHIDSNNYFWAEEIRESDGEIEKLNVRSYMGKGPISRSKNGIKKYIFSFLKKKYLS